MGRTGGRTISILAAVLATVATTLPVLAADGLQYWRVEFPDTNFAERSIAFSEIRSDGARRDSIPPITNPTFIPARKARGLGELEPVLSVQVGKDARAYPLRILLWHEIVNDRVGDVPLLVTYSPLCNSGVVFERELDRNDRSVNLVFGNTGRLRHFDMLMYDRQTESWWQQYTGEAIVGDMTGARLTPLASRVEAWGRFRKRHPDGRVLVPNDPSARPYGSTPYVRMDSSPGAGLDLYELPEGVRPFDRVVSVGRDAWTLKMLREKKTMEVDDLRLTWSPGQNSIHDTKAIAFGRDVGNVQVQRRSPATGAWNDAVHDVTFAFAFKAFYRNGALYYDPPKKDD